MPLQAEAAAKLQKAQREVDDLRSLNEQACCLMPSPVPYCYMLLHLAAPVSGLDSSICIALEWQAAACVELLVCKCRLCATRQL